LAPLFVFCCLLASCAPKEDEAPPKPSIAITMDDVRFIRENRAEANASKCGTCRASIREGIYRRLDANRRIAAAEFMLANPENDDDGAEASGILCRSEGARKRFIGPALGALTHANWRVQAAAIWLLGEIGTRNEAPALTKLLADPKVGHYAVRALAA